MRYGRPLTALLSAQVYKLGAGMAGKVFRTSSHYYYDCPDCSDIENACYPLPEDIEEMQWAERQSW